MSNEQLRPNLNIPGTDVYLFGKKLPRSFNNQINQSVRYELHRIDQLPKYPDQNLQVVAADGLVIVGSTVANNLVISRRTLLLLATFGGLCLGTACAPAANKIDIPPTPIPKPFPTPIKDQDFDRLSPKERTQQLIQGIYPESWSKLSENDLITKLIQVIQQDIYPTLASIMGFDANNIYHNTQFVADKEQMTAALVNNGYNPEQAVDTSNNSIAVTVYPKDRSTGKLNPAKKYIVYNYGKNIKFAKEIQRRVIESNPDNQYTKTPAYLNYLICQYFFDTLIHEATHYAIELVTNYSQQQSDELKTIYNRQLNYQRAPIDIQEFSSSIGIGTSLIDTQNQHFDIYTDFGEVIRAYISEYYLEELFKGTVDTNKVLYDMTEPRYISSTLLLRLVHSKLNITPQEFINLYRSKPLPDLIKLYKEKGNLRDSDVIELFALLDKMPPQFDSADYSRSLQTDLFDKNWPKIQAVIDRGKK